MAYVVRLRDIPEPKKEQLLFLMSIAPVQDLHFVKGPLTTTIANWTVVQHDDSYHSNDAYKQVASLLEDCKAGMFSAEFNSADSHSPEDYHGSHNVSGETISHTNGVHEVYETVPFKTPNNYRQTYHNPLLNSSDGAVGLSSIPNTRERVGTTSGARRRSAIRANISQQTPHTMITALENQLNHRNRGRLSLSDSVPEFTDIRHHSKVTIEDMSHSAVVSQRKIQTPLYPNTPQNREVYDSINKDNCLDTRNQHNNIIHGSATSNVLPTNTFPSPLFVSTTVDKKGVLSCVSASPALPSSSICSNTEISNVKGDTPIRQPLPVSRLVSPRIKATNTKLLHCKGDSSSDRKSRDNNKKILKFFSDTFISAQSVSTSFDSKNRRQCKTSNNTIPAANVGRSTVKCLSPAKVMDVHGKITHRPLNTPRKQITNTNTNTNTTATLRPPLMPRSYPIPSPMSITRSTSRPQDRMTSRSFSTDLEPLKDHTVDVVPSYTAPVISNSIISCNSDTSSWPSPESKTTFLKKMLDTEDIKWMNSRQHSPQSSRLGNSSSLEVTPALRSPMWVSRLGDALFSSLSKMILYRPNFVGLVNRKQEIESGNETVSPTVREDYRRHGVISPAECSPKEMSTHQHRRPYTSQGNTVGAEGAGGRLGSNSIPLRHPSPNEALDSLSYSTVEGIFEHVMMSHCGLDDVVKKSLLSLKSSCREYRDICPVSSVLDYFLHCHDEDVIEQLLLFVDARQKSLKYSKSEVQRVNAANETSYVLDRRYIAFNNVPDAVKSMTACMGSAKEAGKVKLAVGEWVTDELRYGGLAFDFKGHVDAIELVRAVVAERMGKWDKAEADTLSKGEHDRNVITQDTNTYANTTGRQSHIDEDHTSTVLSHRSQAPHVSSHEGSPLVDGHHSSIVISNNNNGNNDNSNNDNSNNSNDNRGNDTTGVTTLTVDVIVPLVSPSKSPATIRYTNGGNDNIDDHPLSPVNPNPNPRSGDNIPQLHTNNVQHTGAVRYMDCNQSLMASSIPYSGDSRNINDDNGNYTLNSFGKTVRGNSSSVQDVTGNRHQYSQELVDPSSSQLGQRTRLHNHTMIADNTVHSQGAIMTKTDLDHNTVVPTKPSNEYDTHIISNDKKVANILDAFQNDPDALMDVLNFIAQKKAVGANTP